MSEELTLNEHHGEMIGSYLRFAKFRRGRHLRIVEQTFEETKLSRLMEGTFTAEEVRDILDELCALLKGDLEMELINTAHTAALLLCQMCCQAQQWHLKLNADVSELENRDMLEKVNKFEERLLNNNLEKNPMDSPLKLNKLQPLAENSGASKLLQMEIDRLKEDNNKLSDKLKEMEKQTVEILEKKSLLAESLAQAQKDLQEWKEKKADIVEMDLKHLETEMLQVKKELETTVCESAFTQQHLECDLVQTKERLLEVQSQLQLAEKELELKFSQTGAFKNMKQMLSSKNEQIKSLRQRLQKYEESDQDN
ncbi:leucine zipper transcription factor-like protein 1 [Uloborus diversus]|uniref:leucine zipper transcription factor-like protein 1 n=1 Tax=Uloborus diversus TaxID=327109 RepID=UPI002409FF77|nr:leucine zipper transcription factor-like protein 1 [Uloborus diversus]XP_054717042.1 leucine zipper transcription factor-like protein 1 [Uloborus diversus]